MNFKISILFLIFVVSGCAATNSKTLLLDENGNQLSTIHVSDNVETPEKIVLVLPDSSMWLFSFGAVGGAVAGATSSDEPEAQFKNLIQKNNIRIGEIVRNSITEELENVGKYQFSDQASMADATLKVRVTEFGFMVPHTFSSEVVPILDVEIDFVNSNGDIFRTVEESVTYIFNPVEPVDPLLFAKNPDLINEKWRNASVIIAKDIF